MLRVAWNNVARGPLARPSIMVEICIGDVRSLFKSNYVSRLTRSQVVAFEIGDATAGGPPRARRRERVAHLHTELNSSIRRPPSSGLQPNSETTRERKETDTFLSDALAVQWLLRKLYLRGFGCHVVGFQFESFLHRAFGSKETGIRWELEKMVIDDITSKKSESA